ncbi:MAG: hypothetical protein WAM82_36705 [Thermoanaerobaculia bacterium]
MKIHEKEIIEELVLVLRKNGHPDLKVIDWPDERIRHQKEIDAIADYFAIEHTTVGGLLEQQGHDARFCKLIAGLPDELAIQLTFQATVTLSYDDLLAIKARSVQQLKDRLLAWLRQTLPVLSEGVHRFGRTPEFPISILVRKRLDRKAGLFFQRDFPSSGVIAAKLRDQLERKAGKLRTYKDKHEKRYTTLLLVELNSSALMGAERFFKLLYDMYPHSCIPGVDEIWVVEPAYGEFWKTGESLVGPLHSAVGDVKACNQPLLTQP